METKQEMKIRDIIKEEKIQGIILPMDIETNLDCRMEERQNQRFLKEQGLD